MKPKWQRIRAKSGPFVGQEFWVEIGPPQEGNCKAWDADDLRSNYIGTYPVYKTNIIYSDGVRRAVIDAKKVELLSNFAEDVPLVPWEQFLADCRKES